MDRNVRFWMVILTFVLLAGTTFSPVASANPPEDGDWTPAANGCWYRGSFWNMPGPSFSVSSCESGDCPSHRVYYDPQYGYYEYWCPPQMGITLPPAPADTAQPMLPLVVMPAPVTAPQAQPCVPPSTVSLVVMPALVTAPQAQQCVLPSTVPFTYDTPWGTFVTFDHWARAFYRYHDRCPIEADIWDFWSTQGVVTAGLVDVCRGCVLVDP